MNKALIGVFASQDDWAVNESLVRLLDRLRLHSKMKELISKFQFVFTGGTYERVVEGRGWPSDPQGRSREQSDDWSNDLKTWLTDACDAVRLPSSRDGGVTMLGNLIAHRQCGILWGFLSAATSHWINPENLAIMRLSDHCRVKRLMNAGSVIEWLHTQAEQDAHRNPQPIPLRMHTSDPKSEHLSSFMPRLLDQSGWEAELNGIKTKERELRIDEVYQHELCNETIALIAHDEMKPRMVEFVVDFGPEFARYGRILTTGTTGKDILDAVPVLAKNLHRCNSGPKGGDIQIATEVILGRCQAVIFFVDPLRPHPHIDDIRVVFGACMARPLVRMVTNEMQARDWMETVIRQARR